MNDEKIRHLEYMSKNCPDIGLRAEIDAQIAYHASRIGRFELARNIIHRIRSESGRGHPASVAIWIIIADGILAFFERLDSGSADRFRRAHLLSVALDLKELRALSAAWLAHSDFGRCEYESMVKSINDCLISSRPLGDLASSRVGLVLASSYLYAGDLEKSREWYEAARQSAVLDGDRATLGAIMYNRAAVALARYRADFHLSRPTGLSIPAVSSAVSSASSFQTLTGNEALSDLLRMSEARLAMIENRFDTAATIFDDIRRSVSGSLSGAADKFFDLEYLYCLAQLGSIGKDEFLSYGINASFAESLDCDDRVVFLGELLAVIGLLSIEDQEENVSLLFGESRRAYDDDIERLQFCLRDIVYTNRG
jgi:hypothetical protein